MVLEQPIKTLGLTDVRVVLHPEVAITVTVNVARSPEEAAKQARGERVTTVEEPPEDILRAEDLFERATRPAGLNGRILAPPGARAVARCFVLARRFVTAQPLEAAGWSIPIFPATISGGMRERNAMRAVLDHVLRRLIVRGRLTVRWPDGKLTTYVGEPGPEAA